MVGVVLGCGLGIGSWVGGGVGLGGRSRGGFRGFLIIDIRREGMIGSGFGGKSDGTNVSSGMDGNTIWRQV